MIWQKPELVSDREAIAYSILEPQQNKYCWAKVVLWFTCPEFHDFEEIDSMLPEKCGYCMHCMDEAERRLKVEEVLAQETESVLDVVLSGDIYDIGGISDATY